MVPNCGGLRSAEEVYSHSTVASSGAAVAA
jgi:hypothetical protein